MSMMMSVSDLGLLGLMLNMLMMPSFAASLGQEVCLSPSHIYTSYYIKFGASPSRFS
ncbi:hypothetical protein RchiOBHm_Chr1g0324711 [Rosa chinensis]|uniref:Uncharacterized protein n=1 Tax=Rosa chinensis TaxID=74649 RepID=A0A2P6S9T3_ROSCH|nr:hypothetical protein RchiOBHm_Chr1g0324711 [Rosa chinensis]